MFGRVCSLLIFPVTLTSTVILAWWLFHSGMEAGLVVGACSLATIAVIATAEVFLPFRRDWTRARGDVVTDILHNLLNSYGFRELCKLALAATLLPAVAWLAQRLGGQWWPVHWPLLVQVLLAALLAELGLYWVHRLCHESAFFWRFHVVHHSPERLYWLNAGRDHPLGVLLFYVAGNTLLILAGTPLEVLTLFYVLEAAHGLFQHANINMRFGALSWIFSTAALHRWHHSERVQEANHNYGQTLIFWDWVFGTRYLPSLDGPERIGLEQRNFPRTFLPQMMVPFRQM